MAQIAMIAGLGVMCLSSSVGAALMMGGGEEDDGGANDNQDQDDDDDDDAPTPDLMLDDKKPYAYEAGKLYACTSGKDVGCIWRAEANGIAAAAGMYDPATKTCPNGDHVYCVNDKTVTMAEYSDNTPAGTGAWNETMHRYAASGKACPTPEAANCQDDQSLLGYQGWGGGNTAKITTGVTNRQCVDNAFLYC